MRGLRLEVQHFFVSKINWLDDNKGIASIAGEQAHHLSRVLRLNVGATLTVAYLEQIYQAEISSLSKDKVDLCVTRKALANHELPIDLILLQGLPKADKLEYIIMKACELGVAQIQPVACEFSISRDKLEKLAKLQVRRNEIALAACKQSKRARLVKVNQTLALVDALTQIEADYILFAYEKSEAKDNIATWFDEHKSIIASFIKERESANKLKIAVLVGPEGGFSPSEVEYISKQAKTNMINLGSRILRTETAPIAILSYLMLEIESLLNSITNL